MASTSRTRRGAADGSPHDWLTSVSAAAAKASRVPEHLLGDYLPMLADAAVHGRRPAPAELAAIREQGRLAAEQGIGVSQAVDLYLSAAWRLWRGLPMVVRSRDRDKVRAAAEAVLRVLDDAVSALVEGHQSARRDMIRYEEALRREFVDDLLRGDADVARMVERAEPFGLDLSAAHHVALAVPRAGDADLETRSIDTDVDRAAIVVERAIIDRFGDRDVLVATKDGRIVVLAPATGHSSSMTGAVDMSRLILAELTRARSASRWQVAAGRAFAGVYGIARSYEEARESVTLAARLNLDVEVLDARDLLVYRVLGRDQAAIIDLVRDVLEPLTNVRGGADVLLQTLHAYFGAGDVATETALRLNVSVRTVTYRLAKVKALTGYSASHPEQRFALHAAVLGARLLEWPHRALPDR